MAKADPRITLEPRLNEALDALANLRKVNKRELVNDLLTAGLVRGEFELRMMAVVRTLGERLVDTDSSIHTIADFIADRWSTDHDHRDG